MWLRRLRHGYAKFGYARQCSKYITRTHTHRRTQPKLRLYHIVMPCMVTPVTPKSVTPHRYATYGYATCLCHLWSCRLRQIRLRHVRLRHRLRQTRLRHMVTLHRELRHSASLRYPASLLAPLPRHSPASLTVTHRHTPSPTVCVWTCDVCSNSMHLITLHAVAIGHIQDHATGGTWQ